MSDFHLFPDIKNKKLVSGLNNTSSPLLQFVQNDTPRLVLNGVTPSTDGGLQRYLPASIPHASLFCEITRIDEAPEAGTWSVRVGDELTGLTTTALPYNATKEAFAAALNALDNVTDAGGITVINSGAANIYRFEWNTPANAIPMEVVSNKLVPFSLGRYYEDTAVPGKRSIKIIKAPIAFATNFTLPSAPASTLTRIRSGSTVANEIQRLTIPPGAIGSLAFSWAGISGKLLQVSTITANAIESALNAPFYAVSTADKRFAVSNPASGVYDIEFVGSYAQTADQPLIGLSLFDQVAIDTPTAYLPLTGQAVDDLLNGSQSKEAWFRLVAVDGEGKETTLAYQKCTVLNRGTDSESASTITAIATEVRTVYVNPDPDIDPVAVAMLGQQFVVATAALDYVFTHNFGTQKIDVVVIRKIAEDPDRWEQVDDSEYHWKTENDNEVHLWFGVAPAESGVGSLEVWVRTLSATPFLSAHRHTTDAIDGVGADEEKTLTEIIAELRGALPTDWPNIPASKISGILSAAQIDLSSLAKALKTNGDFLATLRDLISDPTLIANIARALGSSSDFLDTLKALVTNSDYLAALVAALKTSPDFVAVINEAVKLSGLTVTSNLLVAIPDYATLYPGRDLPTVTATSTPLASALPRPAALLPAIHDATTSSIVYPFPALADDSGEVVLNDSGDTILVPGAHGHRTSKLKDGDFLGNDGRLRYPVSRYGSTKSYFPTAMERELFAFEVNDNMLREGTTFLLEFNLSLQLLNANTRAQYLLVVEHGAISSQAEPATTAGNLEAITWNATPLFSQRLILSQVSIKHSLGCSVTRAVGGALTAKKMVYDAWSNLGSATAAADFAIRARLINFDTENAVEEPVGTILLQMTGAKACIS